MSLVIPTHELPEFSSLPEDCRVEVRQLLRAMRAIAPLSRGIQAAIAVQAAALQISPVTMRKKFDRFREMGWRGLIDRRRFPDADESGLPPAIRELFKELCEGHQRGKRKAAYRELIRMWQRGERTEIDWPEIDPFTGVPRGCTYRNLCRHAPTRYEMTLANIGRGAASAMLPKVLTTRIGLEIGQVYICDDQDYDVQVAFVGVNRKITRPSGFNTLDLASGCEILQGYKPTVLSADGTKQKLRQVDYEWHLVSLLTGEGYREDTGTLIIDEHGTTKAGDDFMERVALATGGKVTFDQSGIHGEQLPGLFRGQPRGNPRYKAARESWFNLLRNEMAMLPGPTGLDRHHAPEEAYGLEKYTRDLCDVIAARPDLAEALQFPVLRWPQFVSLTSLIVRQINLRTEHELEGWGERMANEWRLALDHPWTPAANLLALPAPQRSLADALISNTPGLWRVRQLSPWEVWQPGRDKLKRIEGAMIPVLLGPGAARVVTVTDDHHIVIEDKELEHDEMWFEAELTNRRLLEQRQEVLAYLNPFDAQRLQICDLEGRFLGTAPRTPRPSKLDTEALQHRYGTVRRIETKLMQPVAARGAKVTRERIAMREGNASAIDNQRTARRPIGVDELADLPGAETPTHEPAGGVSEAEILGL